MSTSPFVTGVVTRVKNALTEDQERALRDELARVESANLDGKFTESLNDLVEKRLMQMVSDRRAAGGPQGGCDDDIDTLASNSDFVLPFLKQLLNEYQRGNWPKKATALTVNMGTIVSGITGAQRAEKEAELLAGMKGVASVTTDSDQAPIRGRFWKCPNCGIRNSGTAVLCASCGKEQVTVECNTGSENIETLIHSRPTGMDTTEVGRGNLTVAESPDKGWFCESCNRAVYEFACKSCGSTINNRIRNGRRPRLKPGQWECWGADCNYLNYKQHSICRKCGRDKNVEEDDTWPDKRQVPDPAHRLQLRTFVYTKLVEVFEPLDPLLDAPQKEFDFAAERLKTEALKAFMKRGTKGLQECDPLCGYRYTDETDDSETGSDTPERQDASQQEGRDRQMQDVVNQLKTIGVSQHDIDRVVAAKDLNISTVEDAIDFIFS